MSTPSRFGLAAKILLGTVVAIGAIVLLFDWNWLSHPVEHYITEKSHREVRIGHLDVDLNFSLEPTVKVRDLSNTALGSGLPFELQHQWRWFAENH